MFPCVGFFLLNMLNHHAERKNRFEAKFKKMAIHEDRRVDEHLPVPIAFDQPMGCPFVLARILCPASIDLAKPGWIFRSLRRSLEEAVFWSRSFNVPQTGPFSSH